MTAIMTADQVFQMYFECHPVVFIRREQTRLSGRYFQSRVTHTNTFPMDE